MRSTFAALLRAAFDNGIRGVARPLILLLEPSMACNARCPFCYHWQAETGQELTLDEIDGLLVEAYALGCRFLYFSGGEPTLYPHAEVVLARARTLGYRVSMTTNGSLLAKRLASLAPYLDGITVSLDYGDETHDRVRGIPGLYLAAVDGLALAQRYGLPRRINMSISPANEGHVEKLVALAGDLGAGLHVRLLTRESDSLDITTYDPVGASLAARRLLLLARQHPDVLLTPLTYFEHIAQQKPFTCRPLSLLLTVDSNGRLFVPCPKWEGAKERTAGNIRDRSLADLWHSDEANAIRQEAAACHPGVDCYTSCILDISLLANLSGSMLLEQVLGSQPLLRYFWRTQ